MSEENTSHIKVTNLTFAYPGKDPVLRDLNMTLDAGIYI
jgi:hypothetical protein